MRVTNKIMQNNTLYNINQNKVYQDKLNTQMTTRKKVTKPSDDPVVAIRSLRLRSNLNQVTQYYDKNIPDAEQWLDLTESAINTTIDVVSNMIDECRKGAKGSLKTADRATILESLKQLRDEVYATGDSDYAGRTIFTGYRTDTKLSFEKNETKKYTITEQINNLSVSDITVVNTANIKEANATNYNNPALTGATEQDISMDVVHRIRLAYDRLDEVTDPATDLSFKMTVGYDADGNPMYDDLFDPTVFTVSTPAAGSNPYVDINDPSNDDSIIFIPDTGEVLLGKNAYARVLSLKPEVEITVTYNKSEWADGDLRPEHYFACESDSVKYNERYLTEIGKDDRQTISYDVGFNQTIDINTTADEVFDPAVRRTVDELINMLDEIQKIDDVVEKFKAMKEDSSADQDYVTQRLDAALKAQSLLNDTIQKRFEHGITQFQDYLDTANTALTAVGNRSLRLDLVENRLSAQKSGFEVLTSENEDADLAELAIELKSAQLTYDAALASTGKLMQTTLLNYL